MIGRLGNVIYWATNLIAALLMGLVVWALIPLPAPQPGYLYPHFQIVKLAAAIWVFGFACRFVLLRLGFAKSRKGPLLFTAILARLGKVLYWAASLIATLLVALVLYGQFFGTGDGEVLAQIEVILLAAAIWVFGWGCRFFLTRPGRR